MSTLYILEGTGVGKTGASDIQAMMMPYVALQKVTFTGAAGYSAKLNTGTTVFRVWSSDNVSLEISTTQSASVGSANIVLAASGAEYFACAPNSGLYISAISYS